jgi:DtxR family Mn-dependent transcriptional regulator
LVTLSEENYLKAIYHLSNHGTNEVSTNAIAEKMDTKASSVTDMIKKLADKNLVNYKKYQGVKLTQEGCITATSVIRKHRLWEVFLVNKLNFSWDEVHDIAEQLEHIKSSKLVNQLDAFLDFPTHDPHGDPIPDKDGNITKTDKVILSKISEGTDCVCVGVNDSSDEFLKFLNKHHIALGSQLKVIFKESFDESMTIQIGKNQLNISKVISNNLYVKTN